MGAMSESFCFFFQKEALVSSISGGLWTVIGGSGPVKGVISTRQDWAMGPWPSLEVPASRVRTLGPRPCELQLVPPISEA